jgi:hypothetical protein
MREHDRAAVRADASIAAWMTAVSSVIPSPRAPKSLTEVPNVDVVVATAPASGGSFRSLQPPARHPKASPIERHQDHDPPCARRRTPTMMAAWLSSPLVSDPCFGIVINAGVCVISADELDEKILGQLIRDALRATAAEATR